MANPDLWVLPVSASLDLVSVAYEIAIFSLGIIYMHEDILSVYIYFPKNINSYTATRFFFSPLVVSILFIR